MHRYAFLSVALFVLSLQALAQPILVDTHAHLLSPGNPGNQSQRWLAFSDGYAQRNSGREPFAGAKQLLLALNEARVHNAVAISAAYFFFDAAEAQAENTFTAQQVALAPRRLLGFCGVNPTMPWAVSEVARCQQLKLPGLKFHLVASRFSFANEQHVRQLRAILDQAKVTKMPILAHPGDSEEEFRAFVDLAWSYPELRFIIAHARGLNYRQVGFIPGALNESPSLPKNIYLDISGTIKFYAGSPEVNMLLWYLRQFGMDRVFMGSDFPVHSIRDSYAALWTYPLTNAERAGVAGGNFLRFLREQPRR